MVDENGPFVSMAFLCERPIFDSEDSVLSAIRIVDVLQPTFELSMHPTELVDGSDPSAEEPIVMAGMQTYHLVIGIKSGGVARDFTLTIVPKTPSGELDPIMVPVQLPDGHTGGGAMVLPVNFMQPGQMRPEFGNYWFDVLIDGELATRVPVEIRERIRPQNPPGSAPQA